MTKFSSPGTEWWGHLSTDEQDEYSELQSYPSEIGDTEARLVELYNAANLRLEKALDNDSIFVGGPYNGNSWNTFVCHYSPKV